MRRGSAPSRFCPLQNIPRCKGTAFFPNLQYLSYIFCKKSVILLIDRGCNFEKVMLSFGYFMKKIYLCTKF